MMGAKAGDNAQLLALAEALGWPFEAKHVAYRRTELLTNLFAGPTLAGLDRRRSDPLEPPWPDLILSAGRRNEPLVRWIARQAGRDNVRLVHVGRPWALHECFDLIVTTPQYRLPDKPNILHNEAPMHRVRRERLDAEARAWAPRLAHLPFPRIAVVMGGNAGPYSFDRENGALLGFVASGRARAKGGSLLVTTSARTPKAAIEGLEAGLSAPAFVYRWTKGAKENPYFAFLALADEIVVTSDSMSMLIEAAATGKPVRLFDLDRRQGSHRPHLPADGSVPPRTLKERLEGFSLRPAIYKLGMRLGPSRLTRDVSIIHRNQVAAGRASWLGQEGGAVPSPPPLADTERAAAAVRRLFEEPRPPRPRVAPSPVPEWLRRLTQG
ncbi:MAG: mitochondrial fission ELM1 family protein [Geminicoccaceae bacterium]|nr:mitochondrial fission ELM1 family protein [Geminicoccaceae bacterium]